ncbi:GNAT family N-acetyltransferase [Ectobacillus ponti]|uniref:GNAT family N-acetyltransferase n=1 Tax=Ectobacillus ponti TaxID=2961894 RepID=A0AA41X6D1_9BACI|nr:GNAT family N-acetyltransferase [Ectobacillus ponti]MCP8969532.1 GNAT family N-acetyltransferase [Ectobacillus ponti]
MNWEMKSFAELTAMEVYDMLRERTQVFVVEQNCAYLEVDGYDLPACHLLGKENGQVVAYARILPAGTRYTRASIGRVLVKQEYRGEGLARELMLQAMAFIRDVLQEETVKIQAQEYLRGFYESLGFGAITDPYLDDGIPHIDMVCRL